jgi:steroid 5-alpha reductase family enzyme
MNVSTALVSAAVAIVFLMIGTWLVSVAIRNASIVDITWGFGFVLVSWVVRLQGDTNTTRQWLLVALTTKRVCG